MLRRLLGQMKKNEGFTLIELLVVVAIIALLATFAVPKLFEAINKSKAAPGQADMNTISGALERHYMDRHRFPVGSDAPTVTGELSGGYLKAGTTYVNGYGKGYIYVSDAAGSYYVLIDPMNALPTTNLTLTCGTATMTVQAGTAGLRVYQPTGASAITATDVAAGCSITAGMPAGQTAKVVTN